MAEMLLIAMIDADMAYQLRAAMDQSAIDEMAAALATDGSLEMPAITVYEIAGMERRKVSDGFHRLAAYTAAGRRSIPCTVMEGTEDDLFMAALRANPHHGVRLTNADKRRKALAALARWPELSGRELKEKTGLSHELFNDIRRKAKMQDERSQAAKDQEKADKERVAKLRAELEAIAAKASLAGVRDVELASIGQVKVADLAANASAALPKGFSPGSAGTFLYLAVAVVSKALADAEKARSDAQTRDPDARSADFMRGRNDALNGKAPLSKPSEEYRRGQEEAADLVAVATRTGVVAPAERCPITGLPEHVAAGMVAAARTGDLLADPGIRETIRPVKVATTNNERILQVQADQQTSDLLDVLIAEGEARKPGFAARVESAFNRRVAAREAGLSRLRAWVEDNDWIEAAMPAGIVISVSDDTGGGECVVDGEPRNVGDRMDELGGILHALLSDVVGEVHG